jgi:hypothetical protein
MQAMIKPFYLLQGTIFRTQDDLTNLIEINEAFKDESLIEARKKAFSKCQSYIDVLLESQGLKYESHKQAEKNLNVFFDSKSLEFPMKNQELGQVDSDFDKGLFIYLVTDPTDLFTTLEGKQIYNAKHLIHFFNREFESFNVMVLRELHLELEFYKKNRFYIKDHKCDIYISTLFKEQVIPILKTPIEFQKLPQIKLAEIYPHEH